MLAILADLTVTFALVLVLFRLGSRAGDVERISTLAGLLLALIGGVTWLTQGHGSSMVRTIWMGSLVIYGALLVIDLYQERVYYYLKAIDLSQPTHYFACQVLVQNYIFVHGLSPAAIMIRGRLLGVAGLDEAHMRAIVALLTEFTHTHGAQDRRGWQMFMYGAYAIVFVVVLVRFLMPYMGKIVG